MESAEAALKREIKEELNLEVTEMQYLTSFPNEYIFSNFSVYTTDIAFICKVKNWNNMHIQDDISDIVFVTKQNINWNNISADSIKRIIEAFWNLK